MLRTHLKTAWRALRRRPGLSLLHVGGLAAGLACVLLIALYVHDELRYDRFHPGADRVVRMGIDFVVEGETHRHALTPGVLAPAAYFVMSRWRAGFAYRTTPGPGLFLAVGAVALAVTLATVGTQAWRAARMDPVRALRSE